MARKYRGGAKVPIFGMFPICSHGMICRPLRPTFAHELLEPYVAALERARFVISIISLQIAIAASGCKMKVIA
jgi:hypothetical protein